MTYKCPSCQGPLIAVKSRRFSRGTAAAWLVPAVILFVTVVVVAYTSGPLTPEAVRLFRNVEQLLVGIGVATLLWTRRTWTCPKCDTT